jgi:hypothetical protein
MARRADRDIFLDTLRAQGDRAGNTTLQRELGWDETKYWRIHQQLYDTGVIERGRGYGGTVLLAQQRTDPPVTTTMAPQSVQSARRLGIAPGSTAAIEALAEGYRGELRLYAPVKNQLETHWARRRLLDDFHCEITALQGRRDTGGSWSRPDLALIGYRKYEFLPERVFELFSFEVKPANDISIKGVMEALAHREAATRSYVIYHTAGEDFFALPEAERIEELAARHGVGVYAAKDVNDFSQWAEVVTGLRASPDPEAVDTFIRRTLSEEAKTKLRKWF